MINLEHSEDSHDPHEPQKFPCAANDKRVLVTGVRCQAAMSYFNTLNPSRRKFAKYGMIARRSTMLREFRRNFSFSGEQINRVKYSAKKSRLF